MRLCTFRSLNGEWENFRRIPFKVLTQYSPSNIEKTIKTLQRIAANPFKISTKYLLKASPEY
jgi:hypothetical protein